MTAPLLKGYLYPSHYRSRCPRFHPCTVSQKCQSFDRHCRECVVCESLLIGAKDARVQFGGFVAEGTYAPDLQDSIKTVRDHMQLSLSHPDREQFQQSRDIVNEGTRFLKAQQKIQAFSNLVNLEMEEKIQEAWFDPRKKKLLGRLD